MSLRRVAGVVSTVTGVLLLAGLAAYLAAIGLDKADKLASVIGAFAGLLGLGLGVVGWFRPAGKASPTDGDPPAVAESPVPPAVAESPADNTVHNVVNGSVTGTVIQAGRIDGGVHFDRRD